MRNGQCEALEQVVCRTYLLMISANRNLSVEKPPSSPRPASTESSSIGNLVSYVPLGRVLSREWQDDWRTSATCVSQKTSL